MAGDKLELFISYSRRDMAAADALVTALEGEGFEITIDRRVLAGRPANRHGFSGRHCANMADRQ